MKKAIFEEQTAKALKKWHKDAKDRNKLRKAGIDTSCSGLISGENTPSQGTLPTHLLHSYKYRSSKLELEASVLSSPRSYQSDTDLLEIDQIGSPDQSIVHHHDQPPAQEMKTHIVLIFHFLRLKRAPPKF